MRRRRRSRYRLNLPDLLLAFLVLVVVITGSLWYGHNARKGWPHTNGRVVSLSEGGGVSSICLAYEYMVRGSTFQGIWTGGALQLPFLEGLGGELQALLAQGVLSSKETLRNFLANRGYTRREDVPEEWRSLAAAYGYTSFNDLKAAEASGKLASDLGEFTAQHDIQPSSEGSGQAQSGFTIAIQYDPSNPSVSRPVVYEAGVQAVYATVFLSALAVALAYAIGLYPRLKKAR